MEEAGELMNELNMYQINESPEIVSGQTFSVDEKKPKYRLNLIPDDREVSDSPFFNAQGIWELEKLP